MADFAAIDFETADCGRDSACAVAIVKVSDGRVVETAFRLIRPPRRQFMFTGIHGISWEDVADQPRFAEIWPDLARSIEDVDCVLAHNAGFDRSVLRACCEAAGLEPPGIDFVCTMKLARRLWNIRPTRLPDVCRHLGIELQHHDARSDALACARIGISAAQLGYALASSALA